MRLSALALAFVLAPSCGGGSGSASAIAPPDGGGPSDSGTAGATADGGTGGADDTGPASTGGVAGSDSDAAIAVPDPCVAHPEVCGLDRDASLSVTDGPPTTGVVLMASIDPPSASIPGDSPGVLVFTLTNTGNGTFPVSTVLSEDPNPIPQSDPVLGFKFSSLADVPKGPPCMLAFKDKPLQPGQSCGVGVQYGINTLNKLRTVRVSLLDPSSQGSLLASALITVSP